MADELLLNADDQLLLSLEMQEKALRAQQLKALTEAASVKKQPLDIGEAIARLLGAAIPAALGGAMGGGAALAGGAEGGLSYLGTKAEEDKEAVTAKRALGQLNAKLLGDEIKTITGQKRDVGKQKFQKELEDVRFGNRQTLQNQSFANQRSNLKYSDELRGPSRLELLIEQYGPEKAAEIESVSSGKLDINRFILEEKGKEGLLRHLETKGKSARFEPLDEKVAYALIPEKQPAVRRAVDAFVSKAGIMPNLDQLEKITKENKTSDKHLLEVAQADQSVFEVSALRGLYEKGVAGQPMSEKILAQLPSFVPGQEPIKLFNQMATASVIKIGAAAQGKNLSDAEARAISKQLPQGLDVAKLGSAKLEILEATTRLSAEAKKAALGMRDPLSIQEQAELNRGYQVILSDPQVSKILITDKARTAISDALISDIPLPASRGTIETDEESRESKLAKIAANEKRISELRGAK